MIEVEVLETLLIADEKFTSKPIKADAFAA
jgi:hypothetical protein